MMPQLIRSIEVVTDTTIFMSWLDSGTKGDVVNMKLKMLIKALKMLIFYNPAMQLLIYFFTNLKRTPLFPPATRDMLDLKTPMAGRGLIWTELPCESVSSM